MKLLSNIIKASQYDPSIEEQTVQFADGKSDAENAENQEALTILNQAFEKARQIVESAQNYRAEVMRSCAKQVETEFQEAKNRGYQEGLDRGFAEGQKKGLESGMRQGFSEGVQKAEEENQKYLDELAEMLQSVEASKTEILHKFETDLKNLAVTIARTVIKKELEIDSKTMHSIIRNAVDSYRNQAWVRIHVSGKTADLLTKADVAIAQELKSVSDHVKVVVTEGMNDESCVIEMPDQVIDAGIETQLNKIQSALNGADPSESI
ncbi:MAG: Flagellar assembly protein FliH [Oscillospiraceae bacterium]|jgi:flagellar assembly protein FliH